jgi:threonine-phosphate decarboxylase
MMGHGGDVRAASEETGIPVERIIDFSASINPLGMPGSVVAAISEGIPMVVHYPEPFSGRLTRHIGRWLGVAPGSVICGNGSTELIYLLARAMSPRRVLIPQPTFAEYERACRLQGAACVPLVLRKENGFLIDPDAFASASAGCDMAFLCNPNNPTGGVLEREAVLAIARETRRRACRLVVDEAFIDFLPEHSVVREAAETGHLIVLRSLTKFYALSGLRIGFAVLSAQEADILRGHKEPWTVNTLAEQAAMAAILDTDYQTRTLSVISGERESLAKGFQAAGVEHFPGTANYYLIRMNRAQEVSAVLRHRGILVRDCSNFAGLDGSYLRVAVRSRTENERLMQELAACAA